MNEALKTAISRVPDWQTMEPVDLRVALTEVNRIPKPETQRVWSIAGIAKLFGIAVAETIYGALNRPVAEGGAPGIAARFAATGLDATDPQWLATADALIAGPLADMDAETQQALKWIGHNETVLWTDALTEKQVSDAMQSILDESRMVNATALFTERMILAGDSSKKAAAEVWDQAWIDAEVLSQ